MKQNIIPPYLKPGAKIRIVSPSGKIDKSKVTPAVKWFEEQGYRVELGKYVFATHFQFAGTDGQRLEDLQTALDDVETSVIICSRGGYGLVRIIDRLDFTEFKKHPKWIVGFSDITALHLAINNIGVASVHGAMPAYYFDEENVNENLLSLMNVLKGESVEYVIEKSINNRQGDVKAEFIGGNLSIIASLLGTKYEIDTRGKILFIEEIDEYFYHIDRMIHQLKLAGKFNNLAGLVVGDFTDVKDNDSPFGQSVEDIIFNAVEEFGYPVCYGFPAGHDKKNLAIIFGEKVNLGVSVNGSELKL